MKKQVKREKETIITVEFGYNLVWLSYTGTALGFQIDGADDFFSALNPLPHHKFLHCHGFVKVFDAISQKIDGAFAPCAPL